MIDPDRVDDFAEMSLSRIADLATGGTIVCSLCNASDVTDDRHRPGCPIGSFIDHLEELTRDVRLAVAGQPEEQQDRGAS